MTGIRPVRFEPVPSWCTGGSVEMTSRVVGLASSRCHIGRLCLLFRFEGVIPPHGMSSGSAATACLVSVFARSRRRRRPLRTAEQARASLFFQATKSQRWMPWRQEPMKDVGDCEKPRGAVYLASIRGCPNGETRHSSWSVTLV